ncbi:hypothetical protein QAD02_004487 [Eretmocerus hayati]|uniref:Uncharacterized protein n=1 Tax=Eretmocerus hayati TaxID=131215 RepID=A0ACC2NPP2_9HYME|nr:hypothetical protein QAD02_004487 [Eretmocerus hayati]
MLIKLGADVLKQASNGDTPLHLLNSSTAQEVLDYIPIDLLNSRLLQLNHIESKGLSIFHQACSITNLRLMRYFLEHGVDANDPSLDLGIGCDGNAPLHLVILKNSFSSVEAVKLLLDYNANPNVRNHKGNTPLHLMNKNRFPEIIDMLVNRGADVNAQNALLETPLMTVCSKKNLIPDDLNRTVVFLLNNGADINLTDKNDETPLSVQPIRDLEPFSIVVNTLMKHLTRLEAVDLFVNYTNHKAYYTFLGEFIDELQFFMDPVYDECFEELEITKQVYINDHTRYSYMISFVRIRMNWHGQVEI